MEHKVVDKQEGSASQIAIVGMACVFPSAPDLKAFWQNILAHVDAVGEPPAAWDASRYLNSRLITSSAGGFLGDLLRFDPQRFGIMPNSVDGVEPGQFLALQVASDALADAGYAAADCDHSETGVVMGYSSSLNRGQCNSMQHHIVIDQTLDLLEKVGLALDDEQLASLRGLLVSKLPQYNANIVPALVPNNLTGRIANRLDLKGPNFIIDAACASSLLAVNAAIDELQSRRSRMMLVGGVNTSLPAEILVVFSQINALSRRGRVRAFEKGADGTLLGEGVGMLVLKRLDDALEDDDRIYAVIQGLGQSSDGKSTGLLAPSEEGEFLAMRRAYDAAGIDPATVSMVEAHGTGIPLGDGVEVASLRRLVGDRQGLLGKVAMGSVKSMVSHCMPAAGIASLIKTALALHHRVLPPTLCEEVNPELGIERTPLYVNNRIRPWLSDASKPRRAGVNSFGFGGINTHAILEQAPVAARAPSKLSRWPAELMVLSAPDQGALLDKVERLIRALREVPSYELSDIAFTLADRDEGASHRLTLVATDNADLIKKLAQAAKTIRRKDATHWTTRSGISYASEPLAGSLAFLFPGEGSQYRGMMEELVLHLDGARGWFDFWKGVYEGAEMEPSDISHPDIVYPPHSELSESVDATLTARLYDMDIGSEAVFIGAQAMFAVLGKLGITADAMLGHSSGESSALVASGAMRIDSADELALYIRELNSAYNEIVANGDLPLGALLAVGALNREDVDPYLGDDVVIAMENCRNQLVLFGQVEAIDQVEAKLTGLGGICVRLPFDRGYHTHWFKSVAAVFEAQYERQGLSVPDVPLYSCASASRFPSDVGAVRALAVSQWCNKVRFKDTVEKMHADGVRFFVEVGPSGNLTSFVQDILGGKEAVSLATNLKRKGDMAQLLTVVGELYVHHKVNSLVELFAGRGCDLLDWDARPNDRPGMPLDNTMPVIRLTAEELKPFSIGHAGGRLPTADDIEDTAAPEHSSSFASIDESPVLLAHGGDQQVMLEHLQLMRQFLSSQSELMQAANMAETTQANAITPLEPRAYPLLSDVIQNMDGQLVARAVISLFEDNYLADHVLSGPVSESDPELIGLSCVPLQVSLEILAEASAALLGRSDVTVIEHVQTFDWITLEDHEAELMVEARLCENSATRVAAWLKREDRLIVKAEFGFAEAARLPAMATLTQLEPHRWSDSELYRNGMFHGPLFQSIKRIVGCSADGIEGELAELSLTGFLRDEEVPCLVLNPVLLDASGQLSAFWTAQQVGTDYNNFPSTIERIELLGPCPQSLEGIQLSARQVPHEIGIDSVDAPRQWHYEYRDRQGQAIVRIASFEHLYFSVPHDYYNCRRDPLQGWVGGPLESVDQDEVLLWGLENYSLKFCTQSGGIFARILAHATLSYDELIEWYALSGGPQRTRDWLLGRICIKQAVRYWVHRMTGRLLYPTDVQVLHDELGAPSVDGWWNGAVVSAPQVSLSHDRDFTIAAVGSRGQRVGVDIETIGSVRYPRRVLSSFGEAEQALLQGVSDDDFEEKVLRLWCAREAVAKLFGTGLQGDPALLEVDLTPGDWEQCIVSFGGNRARVMLERAGDSIIAYTGFD